MISQFYVLSLRGDTIIFRDYLGNVQKVGAVLAAGLQYQTTSSTPYLLCHQGSSEVFFRRMKFWDKEHSDAPPVFMLDGVSYLHVKVRPIAGMHTRRSH